MSSKIMYAKNGRPYRKLANGQVRFVKGPSKKGAKKAGKKVAKKGKKNMKKMDKMNNYGM